ncbi:hypothetical protein RRG08_059018 [Elysia crispata]|uniref:receptor protein-tyrosine kinase n=1 Tax=Elysia crispata TaxID=231223 RepID=A0AAE0Z5Z0_9GAST|nr:hypothetical protein RRG08_059018 [Elysia crispata]
MSILGETSGGGEVETVDGVCGDTVIQCDVSNLRLLHKCTVIEGSLFILQMNRTSTAPEDYDAYSFPELREITGYMVISGAFGLRTLRHLFPNLAVIRGEKLFLDTFALVVHGNRHLRELGLVSLSTIMQGAVRLSQNSFLCYVDTVDWPLLTVGVKASENVFENNRDVLMCADICPDSCNVTNSLTKVKRARCWTSEGDGCQKGPGLDCECDAKQVCKPDGSCCSPYCAGGCTGDGPHNCIACKNVNYDGKCDLHCPKSTFLYSGRRCLTDAECLGLNLHQQGSSTGANNSQAVDMDLKPKLLRGRRNGKCVFKCPKGYTLEEKSSGSECVECVGFCPKVCNKHTIHVMKDSEKLRGCTKIMGDLTLHIKGGKDVDKELTKNLGNIREITGMLQVISSHALLTLHFFQSLERIGSHNEGSPSQALVIMDNKNLEELFEEQQLQKMEIYGNVSIVGNMRLCRVKIDHFMNSTGVPGQSDDLFKSNGQKLPCKDVELELHVESIFSDRVTLTFNNHNPVDSRGVLHYSVHYKEVTEPVKDIYEGRDACSENSWQTKKIDVDRDISYTKEIIRTTVSFLKPFTKYAFYVNTIVLETAIKNAKSGIIYVLTDIDKPSDPEDLETIHISSRKAKLLWKPPRQPNSILTYYLIWLKKDEKISNKNFDGRDLCSDSELQKLLWDSDRRKQMQDAEKRKKEAQKYRNQNCCDCPKSETTLELLTRNRREDIGFENSIQDSLFQKRWSDSCNSAFIKAAHKLMNSNIHLGGQVRTHRKRRDVDQLLYSVGTNFSRPIRKEDLSYASHVFDMNLSASMDFDSSKLSKSDPYNNYSKFNVSSSQVNKTDESKDLNKTDESKDLDKKKKLQENAMVFTVLRKTQKRLDGLDHFSWYTIEVAACHSLDYGSPENCGMKGVTKMLTLADPDYDAINESSVRVTEVDSNRTRDRLISWDEPSKPNGMVLKHILQLQRLDEKAPRTICISREAYKNNSGGYRLDNLEPGNYSLRIQVFTEGGKGPMSQKILFYIDAFKEDESGWNEGTVLAIIFAVIFFLVIVLSTLLIYYKFAQRRSKLETVSVNPHYFFSEDFYVPDEWEVGRDNISFVKEVGQGSFGKVYEGIMRDPDKNTRRPVAIKTVNDKADFFEKLKFLKEATTMKYFECHHVVKLLGVVSQGQPALMIMELMALGDLRNYLRKCREDELDFPDFHPPTASQIRQIAGEIADGMAYLSHRKIIHRDLAARNCLVAGDGTVKIGDFGMARELDMSNYYRKDQKALLPVRWMAPESLNEGIFTTMSDVWSYGVVIYEMVTLAEQPYIGQSNDEVFAFVIGGGTMRAPVGCPQDLYDIMQQCWAYNPKHRPTFKFLIEMLLPYMSDAFKQVSFFLQEVAYSDADDDMENTGDDIVRIGYSDGDCSQYDVVGGDEDHWDGDDMWRKRWAAESQACNDNDDFRLVDEGNDGLMVALPKAEEEYANLDYASGSDGEDFSSAKGLSVSGSPHPKGKPNPYLSSGPACISPSPSSPISRSPVHHGWNLSPLHTMGSSHVEERSPLLLPTTLPSSPSSKHTTAEPYKTPLAALDILDDIDREEDEISGADSEFEDTVDFGVLPGKGKDKKFRSLSGDAHEPSERLRLLSDSSQAESWKSAEDSAHRSDRDSGSSQQFSRFHPDENTEPLNQEVTPSFLSPSVLPWPLGSAPTQRSSTPSTMKSSKSSSSSSLPLTSQTTGISDSSIVHAPVAEAVAVLPPAVIAPSQIQAEIPAAIQPPFSLASLKPFIPAQNSKVPEDPAHTVINHVEDRRESVNSLDSSSNRQNNSSHSNSNTGSIKSASVDGSGGGSKDSSSSAGSHHRFATNGHGPFSRQAAALC